MTASASNLVAAIRPAVREEWGFVIDPWMKGYQRSSEVEDLRPSEYNPAQRNLVNRLLARSVVFVAHEPSTPGYLLGFVVAEREPSISVAAIHYVYVRDNWRRFGVGSQLLTHAIDGAKTVFYTSRASRRADEKPLRALGARFNHYLR